MSSFFVNLGCSHKLSFLQNHKIHHILTISSVHLKSLQKPQKLQQVTNTQMPFLPILYKLKNPSVASRAHVITGVTFSFSRDSNTPHMQI